MALAPAAIEVGKVPTREKPGGSVKPDVVSIDEP